MDHAEKMIKMIEGEKSVEVLAGMVRFMIKENNILRDRIAEADRLKAEKNQMQLNFEEQIKSFRREIYGKSSEKRALASDRARDKSQQDALIFSQAAFPALDTREDQKNKKLRDKWRNIPEQTFDCDIDAASLKAESESRGLENPSSEQWEELKGAYDTVTTIQIVERSYVKQIHRKKKYKLKDEFNKDQEKDVIITADGPSSLLPGMNYATEVVGSVIADKYVSHLPLERQTRQMESLGLTGMKTSTLSRMCALGAASLEPTAAKILKELIGSDLCLHLDETPWPIQKEKDGYLWVISNRYGSYYFFKPTRSGQVIKEKLVGYTGRVLTDGFGGYNILEEMGIEQGFCWGHARRKFFVLESHDESVKPILDDIDILFTIEREAKNFEDLKRLRSDRSAPVVMRLQQRLFEEYPNSRPNSEKRKAIEYVTKRWKGFTLFLRDERLALSNNEAERTIRHAVVGRKAYYGSATHSGAETAATLFTVIESAKKNDVDPRTYLLMALSRLARGEPVPTPLEYAKSLRCQN